jgi:hypothetical protein
MAVTYQFALGYNNAAGLVTVSLQPSSPGVVEGRREMAGNRLIYVDGYATSQWRYGFLRDDSAARYRYSQLLTEFGLTTEASRECTVRMPNNLRVATNYNAIIIRPDIGESLEWQRRVLQNVAFELIGMAAL